MDKIKISLFVVIGIVLVLLMVFFAVRQFKPKVAGIYIESTPVAMVYIDGTEVGRTPYESTQKPGEVVVKLVPDSFDIPLAPYETKVNLIAGVQTVIKRSFGETEETSSGEIISFEKIDKNQVSLAVVSIPDSAELLIDGSERAFTPHRTTAILPGVHSLILKTDGYQEKGVDVRTHQGYKLTAVVKLAKIAKDQEVQEESQKETGEEAADETKYGKIKILSTPTGFLRVRNEPSTLGKEVGTIKPDETYDLLETDQKTGWYKIKFVHESLEEETEGWISNQYAQIVEPVPSTSETTLETDS